MTSFGWAIHVDACDAQFNDATARYLAVRLVFPAASADGAWDVTPGKADWTVDPVTGKGPVTTFGNMLRPWTWADIDKSPVSWQVYVIPPAPPPPPPPGVPAAPPAPIAVGLIKPLPLATLGIGDTIAVDTLKTIRTAYVPDADAQNWPIKLKDGFFFKPFAMGAPVAASDGNGMLDAYPHLFSTAGHLPIELCMGALGLAGVLQIPNAMITTAIKNPAVNIDTCTFCACPQFTNGPFPGGVIKVTPNNGRIDFTFTWPAGTVNMPDILFKSNLTLPGPAGGPAIPPAPINLDVPIETLTKETRSHIALSVLHPLRLFCQAWLRPPPPPAAPVDPLPEPTAGTLARALTETLGQGWGTSLAVPQPAWVVAGLPLRNHIANTVFADYPDIASKLQKQAYVSSQPWDDVAKGKWFNAIIQGMTTGTLLSDPLGKFVANLRWDDNAPVDLNAFQALISSDETLLQLTRAWQIANLQWLAQAGGAPAAGVQDQTATVAANYQWKDVTIRNLSAGVLASIPWTNADASPNPATTTRDRLINVVTQGKGNPYENDVAAWQRGIAAADPSYIPARFGVTAAIEGASDSHTNITKQARTGDAALLLRLGAQSANGGSDMKGYAVALRAGLTGLNSYWSAPQWITNSTYAVTEKSSNTESWITKTDNTLLTLEGVLPVSLVSGANQEELTYQGWPLAARAAISTTDPRLIGAGSQSSAQAAFDGGAALLDKRFAFNPPPNNGQPALPVAPRLGYGMSYQAIATRITNCGLVDVPDLRATAGGGGAQLPAKLLDWGSASAPKIDQLFTGTNKVTYMRTAIPGQPSVVFRTGSRDKEVSRTQLQAWTDNSLQTTTQLLHKQSGIQDSQPSIVLLAPPRAAASTANYCFDNDKAPTSIALKLDLPKTHYRTVQRWLETEIFIRENGVQVIPDLQDLTWSASFLSRLCQYWDTCTTDANGVAVNRTSVVNDENTLDIAVDEIGVIVEKLVLSAAGKMDWQAVPLSNGANAGKTEIRLLPTIAPVDGPSPSISSSGVDMIVQSSTSDGITVTIGGTNALGPAQLTIAAGPGVAFRVRTFSLVQQHWFDQGAGTNLPRFDPAVNEVAQRDAAKVPLFDQYKEFAFKGRELYFEVAPQPDAIDSLLSSFILDGPAGPRYSVPWTEPQALLQSLTADLRQLDARWLACIALERHEWSWSGLPLDLPFQPDRSQPAEAMGGWFAAFAGLESQREAKVTPVVPIVGGPAAGAVVLTLSFPGNGTVLDAQALRSPRPGRYVAYVLTPVLRFKSVLVAADIKNGAESIVAYAGGPVPGDWSVDGNNVMKRLPPPTLSYALPLTLTAYPGQDNKSVQRAPQGNLLVFQDPIRKTGTHAWSQGIGESIEVDLVETRNPLYRQIGANPISAPLAPFGSTPVTDPKKAVSDPYVNSLDLYAAPPFGLTAEPNQPAPNLAQTAIVVHPVIRGGRVTVPDPQGGPGTTLTWPSGPCLMAQIRTRRTVDARTLNNTWLAPAAGATDVSTSLALRAVGDDFVPEDFVIHSDGQQLTIKAMSIAACNVNIDFAANFGNFPILVNEHYRLLCTFHAGMWQSSQPGWRMQCLLQISADEIELEQGIIAQDVPTGVPSLGWHTIQRYSPYSDTSDMNTKLSKIGGNGSGAVPPQPVQLKIGTTVPGSTLLYRIPVSDYTTPQWLNFIGAFMAKGALEFPQAYQVNESQSGGARQYQLTAAVQSILPVTPIQFPTVQAFSRTMTGSKAHVLLLCSPIRDVARPESGEYAGEPAVTYQISAWANASSSGTADTVFFQLMPPTQNDAPSADAMPPDSIAYLLSIQLTPEAISQIPDKLDVDTLLAYMFPADSASTNNPAYARTESMARLMPEMLGPIRIQRQ